MKWKQRITIIVSMGALFGCVVAIDVSESLLNRTVALSSVFTGLLTLTGFLFTARTFITFKLNEVVYGQPDYRKRVEELRTEGAYAKELYEPLKEIDARVGKTCIWVFSTMICILFFSVLPRDWSKSAVSMIDLLCDGDSSMPWRFVAFQIATVLIFTAICLVAAEVLLTIISVNQNIRSIISEWEDRYRREKANTRK